ncbi:glutamate--cysteine ligase [Pelistega europaea]|uniref:Glutamate--cysteine ligase n=1 Tax=Pelistega europaea TaxID=106147 RepID=A0A7Y4LAF1_9BURK|nr:glutamate--cysteine ligase [Pelistega europaea]
MPQFSQLLTHRALLKDIRRGIEREALRLDDSLQFAHDAHPHVLGSALTHPNITTDYSESLIELITDPHTSVPALFKQLQEVHAFTLQQLPEQSLWSQSMPCELPAEADIPIAEYGKSNSGKLRHIYREGLAVRYGKKMQCIAGLHYNFSLPDALWQALPFAGNTPKERQNNGYMALIRNFKRYSWLLMYLFGASPAVNASFLDDKQKALLKPLVHCGANMTTGMMPNKAVTSERAATIDEHSDMASTANTYYQPWATSLRMSDLGYHNDAQSNLKSCFNDLESFAKQIYTAVTTSWPAYEKIGTQKDGKWIQLNTNILQIENEFYATIRPKRSHGRCERPVTALMKNGIQYIEVRCIDIDPFAPLGITPTTCYFLDSFLLFCAIHDSPLFAHGGECPISEANFNAVVNNGLNPELVLQNDKGNVLMTQWGLELIEQIRPYAELLAAETNDDGYLSALAQQQAKLQESTLCPSHRVIKALQETGTDFNAYFQQISTQNAQKIREYTLSSETTRAFEQQSVDSFIKQAAIEAADSISFEEYLQCFTKALTLHPEC